MKIFKAHIKETSGAILDPKWITDDYKTKQDAINWWGLEQDDVEYYELTEEPWLEIEK